MSTLPYVTFVAAYLTCIASAVRLDQAELQLQLAQLQLDQDATGEENVAADFAVERASKQGTASPCVQLEAFHDVYRSSCSRKECPGKAVETRSSYCRQVESEYRVGVGLTVTIPIFAVPLAIITAKIHADGVLEYHAPIDADGYKSVHVSAGIEIAVNIAAIGSIAFEFIGSLTVRCNDNCDKFSTLWSAFTAELTLDYFKFMRKSDAETEEVRTTLTQGLRDAEDLKGNFSSLLISIEYAGSFRAKRGGELQVPKVVDIDAKLTHEREFRHKTTVLIAPLGPLDTSGRPTYTMKIDEYGYEWVSISRIHGKNSFGIFEATVYCGDKDNDFVFEVSLTSSSDTLTSKVAGVLTNTTPATVKDWTGTVSRVLQDKAYEKGYCQSGAVYGHKKMKKRIRAVTNSFSDLLKRREFMGTETVSVRVPNSGSTKRAEVVLKRETDIPLLPPALDALFGNEVTVLGQQVRYHSKRVDDLGADDIMRNS